MQANAAASRRCATCQCWSGVRGLGEQAETVSIESETITGICTGGPWNGTERRARAACGRWTLWQEIALPNIEKP